METPKPPYPEYFDAKDKGDKWHLFCKICKQGWSLRKAPFSIGNSLHLLNHYRECEVKNGRQN